MNAHQRHVEQRLRVREGRDVPAWLMPGGDPQKKAVAKLQQQGRLGTEQRRNLLVIGRKRRPVSETAKRLTETVKPAAFLPDPPKRKFLDALRQQLGNVPLFRRRAVATA